MDAQDREALRKEVAEWEGIQEDEMDHWVGRILEVVAELRAKHQG